MTGRLRLWSGYVLFFYVVTHLLNHALGLVSLRALEEGRHWFAFVWSNPAGQILQMVLSHETGHFFGLMAHSRRCIDVMSYYTDAQGQTCSTRDGGSFSVRRVTAIQKGNPIFTCSASFQYDEKGFEHQGQMPAVVGPITRAVHAGPDQGAG